MKVNVLLATVLLSDTVAQQLLHSDVKQDVSLAVSAVLEATSQPSCSLILLTDGVTSHSTIVKEVSSEISSPWGVTVMEVTAADGQDGNVTLAMLSHLVDLARQVRLGSWCVRVVVVSHDPDFLSSFAESSLKGRLLVWATKLLVVTRLTLPQLHALLPASWTFTMMNTIVLNLENTPNKHRVTVYAHHPYSPTGAQVVRVASWSPEGGLHLLTKLDLFHEKFDDFHGATIPVTVLPFPPYWVEEEHQTANGTTVKIYTGTDGELALSMARTYNFTFHVLPVKNWPEVVQKVEVRESFMAPVYYTLLPQRLKRFDMTFVYEFTFKTFSMRKPSAKPRWQSLYYPLADQVWAAILGLQLCVPAIILMVLRVEERRDGGSRIGAGAVVQDVAGMLLGQSLPPRLPSTSSSRLLVAAWLVFAFIIGTVYRGNLTAHLTLPKYPPRPETVQELVDAVDKITGGSYQAPFKAFYTKSSNKVYQKLGKLLFIGPSVLQGLQQALEHNQAVVEGRRNLQHVIAENFTQPDGSTDLYVGREYIMPAMAAWPIPHDAPYRPQIERCMMAVIEAGLYEKWSSDQMTKARRKSSSRQREYLAQQQQQQKQQGAAPDGTQSGRSIRALTLTHTQGPLILLLLGIGIAGLSFTVEIVASLILVFTE
ncbi:ionotropic receptor 93a-like [Panulirus ornatus]|uniref:ionotropic receptor 93a-like n=1 Tax=Panulirus ornatus TaxID=150431 RepID=UPI003A89D949